jgi:hypothetical protein
MRSVMKSFGFNCVGSLEDVAPAAAAAVLLVLLETVVDT